MAEPSKEREATVLEHAVDDGLGQVMVVQASEATRSAEHRTAVCLSGWPRTDSRFGTAGVMKRAVKPFWIAR